MEAINNKTTTDIMNTIEKSYHELWSECGVRPNAIMISMDMLDIVKHNVVMYSYSSKVNDETIMGLPLVRVIGENVVKAIIMK